MSDSEKVDESIAKRIDWIKKILKESGARGIVVANSGGKDCTLVLILCKMAGLEVLSLMMPCESRQNYTTDLEHARLTCQKFNIENIEIDLTAAKKALSDAIKPSIGEKVAMAYANINPRLRMTAIYTVAQSRGYLVAGTGNLSEYTMGYFTKWGDGAYDFNPIADLTASEVTRMLKVLDASPEIINKAPSAGLYEGQTDEQELGVSYKEIDDYIRKRIPDKNGIIEKTYSRTRHKRCTPPRFGFNGNLPII